MCPKMSLDQIVQVTITTQGQTPSRRSFGIPMAMAYHSLGGPRVQTFASFSGAQSAGVTLVDEPDLYRMLEAIFQQNPRVSQVKVGRRENGTRTKVVRLEPLILTEGHVYRLTIDDVVVEYTVPAAAVLATVLAGIETAITTEAIPSIDTTDDTSGTHLEITMVSGRNVPVAYDILDMGFADTSADPGIATDLAEIVAIDPAFYEIVLDSNSPAEVLAAAAWTETTKYLLSADTADTDTLDPVSTTDIAAQLATLKYRRTNLWYSPYDGEYLVARITSKLLTYDPGVATRAYKTVTGIPAYTLNTTQEGSLNAKYCNHYQTVAGVDVTRDGRLANSEFIDVIRFADWVEARIQERIFGLLVLNDKLPYTLDSRALILGEILAQLKEGIRVGGLAADPEPVADAPLPSEVSPSNRANRLYPDFTFSATLAGAIHLLRIEGTLLI